MDPAAAPGRTSWWKSSSEYSGPVAAGPAVICRLTAGYVRSDAPPEVLNVSPRLSPPSGRRRPRGRGQLLVLIGYDVCVDASTPEGERRLGLGLLWGSANCVKTAKWSPIGRCPRAVFSARILNLLMTSSIKLLSDESELCLEIADPADMASLELCRALKEHLRTAEGQ
ncbi:unnamed protein product [Arctogadus glacialis]